MRRPAPEVRVAVRSVPGDAGGLFVAVSEDVELVVVGGHSRRLLARRARWRGAACYCEE
ncbi:hypothetical protein JTP77_016385 [Streptomyces sp. S9]|nr:hypothetical protein [Streptomyces sp. S9]